MTAETGHVTGTKDKNYNLIRYTEKCLDNALRLETYIQDAERAGDKDVADLFCKAQSDSRKGAELAEQSPASGRYPPARQAPLVRSSVH